MRKLNRVLRRTTLQVLFAFQNAMSAIAALKSTNPSIERSTKYDAFVGRMTAEALRLDIPPKLLAVAHKVLKRPRDYIMVGAALVVILVVMLKIFAHGNTFLA